MMKTWIEIVTLFIIIISTLFISFKAMLFEDVSIVKKVLYAILAISAMLHVFSRDYYLRFLGHCALPCEELTEKTPIDADTEVTVNVSEPNVNVIYWASETNDEIVSSPMKAYGKWTNSGVTRSDNNGVAKLSIRKPSQYKVPYKPGGPLRPHIHYRVCKSGGMIDRVETKYI